MKVSSLSRCTRQSYFGGEAFWSRTLAGALSSCRDAIKGALHRRCTILLISIPILVTCGGRRDEPQVGSETNFLKHCDGQCENGLTCLCGVCTRACTGTNECADLSKAAECVAVPEGTTSTTVASCQQGSTCEFSCISQLDCVSLGSEYRCETGFCRKGNLVCPVAALTPGDRDGSVVVDGTTRNYTLHVPAAYSGGAMVPLVLDFHPMGLGLAWEQANSGYRDLSEQQGFLVVWPRGLEDNWNVGPCCTTSKTVDDYAFARTLVHRLSIEACVDPRRVYAVGFSMGGAMAQYLGCNEAEVFAAVASSSMDLFTDATIACQPSRAVAQIAFRGTADTVVPYAGGTSSPPGHPEIVMDALGAVGTFSKWASLDQCTGAATAEDSNGCSTYSACAAGTAVTLCTTQGGGQVVGSAGLAWDFLSKHPMP